MNSEPLEWLPLDVSLRPGVRSRVDQAVLKWSQTWISKRRLKVCTWTTAVSQPRGDQDGAGWQRYTSGLAISASRRARTRLLDWGLDIQLDELALTETDRQLIEQIERRMLEGLVGDVEQSLSVTAEGGAAQTLVTEPFAGQGGAIIGLTDSGSSALLTLAVPFAVLLPLCLEDLPPPRPRPEPLSSRAYSVGSTRLSIEAGLGQAEMTLKDLRNLAVGDVLVLDKALDEPAELSLAGTEALLAQASIADQAGQMTLTLESSSR